MRRVLRPVALGFPFFLVSASIGYPADALGIDAVSRMVRSPIWQLSGFIMPVAFLIGVLRLRMTRSAVAGAVLELGALPTLGRLQQVLQVRLGDPGLEVLRWSPTQAAWIDQDGRAVAGPNTGADRALLVIDRDGTPVAAIDHDAALLDDPALADTVAAAARVALDATDLRDELRTHGGQQHGLPTGEVTFVFGDIEGSTPLLESLVLATPTCWPRSGGLPSTSPTAMAAGWSMRSAMRCSSSSRGRRPPCLPLSSCPTGWATRWPEGRTVRLRIGVHTGVPDLTPSGYVGLDVHRAARVMAAAHGGQVVVTMPVAVSMEPTVGVSLDRSAVCPAGTVRAGADPPGRGAGPRDGLPAAPSRAGRLNVPEDRRLDRISHRPGRTVVTFALPAPRLRLLAVSGELRNAGWRDHGA